MKKDYVLTSACFVDYFGILPGYGYIVKDIAKTDDGVKLVKMKSPWKKNEATKNKEWSGKFSRSDPKLSEKAKKSIGYDKLK